MSQITKVALIVGLGILPAILGGAPARSSADQQVDDARNAAKQVFKKEIAPGETVIVTRELFAPARLGILGSKITAQHENAACVRVWIKTAKAPPALIASQVESSFSDFSTGINVLDAFVGDEDLVLAGTMDDMVFLWRISVDVHRDRPNGMALVRPGMYAVRSPLRATVSVKMTPTDHPHGDETWALTVVDKRGPKPRTYEYAQAEHGWEFKLVKPATSPLAIGDGSPPADEKRADTVLLDKSLSGNRHVALVVRPPMPISDVAELIPRGDIAGGALLDATGRRHPHTCAFCLQLQLVVPDRPRQVLWSEVLLGPSGPGRAGCDGLDMLVTPKCIVLALAHGISIELIRVDVASGAAEHYPLSNRWTDTAALRLLDRAAVSVQLSNDNNGAVVARVQDVDSKRTTLYKQDPERWQFSEITTSSK